MSKKFEKLTRDSFNDTKIMAGHSILSIDQLEKEIDMNTDIGRKLKKIEKELDKY